MQPLFLSQIKRNNIINAIKSTGLIIDLVRIILEYFFCKEVLYTTHGAFAAILYDGHVVTWGDNDYGGDSSSVQDELMIGVETIYATSCLFFAKLFDGRLIAWGDPNYGIIQSELKTNINKIYSNDRSFVAKTSDNKIISWGSEQYGGDTTRIQHYLKDCVDIYATCCAFCAKLPNGQIITWGISKYGGDISSVIHELKVEVETVYATYYAFCAKLLNGKIIGKHNQKNRDGNDFTLTRVGDININYIDKPYYLTDNGFSLKSKQENIITKYIYYLLSYNKDYLTKLYHGTAQKVISKTNLKSIKIPVPLIEQQTQIVEHLDFLHE